MQTPPFWHAKHGYCGFGIGSGTHSHLPAGWNQGRGWRGVGVVWVKKYMVVREKV